MAIIEQSEFMDYNQETNFTFVPTIFLYLLNGLNGLLLSLLLSDNSRPHDFFVYS